MSEHSYFRAGTVAGVDLHPDPIAIRFSDKPQRLADGRISLAVGGPCLVVTGLVEEPDRFAEEVAAVLQENAHRFFASARAAKGGEA